MRYLKEYNQVDSNEWYYPTKEFQGSDIVMKSGSSLSRAEFDRLSELYHGCVNFYYRGSDSVYDGYNKLTIGWNSDIRRIIIRNWNGKRQKDYLDIYKGVDDWFWVKVFIDSGWGYDETFYKCDQVEGLIRLIGDKFGSQLVESEELNNIQFFNFDRSKKSDKFTERDILEIEKVSKEVWGNNFRDVHLSGGMLFDHRDLNYYHIFYLKIILNDTLKRHEKMEDVHDNSITIYKYQDEWFILEVPYVYNKKGTKWYKCDQLDSLIGAIKNLKN